MISYHFIHAKIVHEIVRWFMASPQPLAALQPGMDRFEALASGDASQPHVCRMQRMAFHIVLVAFRLPMARNERDQSCSVASEGRNSAVARLDVEVSLLRLLPKDRSSAKHRPSSDGPEE